MGRKHPLHLMMIALLPVCLCATAGIQARAANRTVRVRNTVELRRALRGLRPGTTVLIAPGDYEGGHYVEGLQGTEKAPIVLRGADEKKQPRFTGGGLLLRGLGRFSCGYGGLPPGDNRRVLLPRS